MTRRYQKLLLPFIAVLLVGMLGACGETRRYNYSNLDTSGGPMKGDWVVIHSLSDPENLNLLTSSDAVASEIYAQFYETLTITDPFTLESRPWIADSLPIVSPDKLTYDFRLRKDVRYSDGHPVTADDFIFYLKVLKNPNIEQAAPIRGYYSRVDSASRIDGDPYRLRVVMSEPYYLGNQWAGGLYAIPKHIWDPKGLNERISFKELNAGDTNNRLIDEFATWYEDPVKAMDPKFLIGTGPYVFSEFRQNDRVVLRRNDRYWNAGSELGKAWPERLLWISINDYNTALVSLRAGDLDVMPRLEKVQYTRVKSVLPEIGLAPVEYDYPAYSYVGYNADRPLFRDAKVRNALARAINRQAIIDKIYFGMAVPVQSPLFYKRPEYDTTLPIIRYSLDSARAMLTEAGWKDTDGDGILDKVIDGKKVPFEFTILLNSGNQGRQQMAILFVNELKKLGIRASSSSLDWSTFLQNTRKGEYDAYIGGWAMSPVEGDMYQIWHSKSAEEGGSNYVKFRNAEVDGLIEQIRGEFDFERRKELYAQIQKIIHREQPYNFLVSEKFTGAYSARFQNAEFFAPRPCYNPAWWWAPKSAQRYEPTPAVAAR